MQRITNELTEGNGLVLALWGREKTGKSRFLYTAPQPIYVFDLDDGLVDLAPQYPGTEVYFESYHVDLVSTSVVQREAAYKKLLDDIAKYSAEVPNGGTIAVDTATALWGVQQSVYVEEIRKRREAKAKEGEEAKIFPFDYAAANRHYDEVVARLHKNKKINVILLNRATESYTSDGKPTGSYKMQGNKDTPYLVQASLSLTKAKVGTENKFYATFDSCRLNTNIEGLTVEDPNWDLVAGLIRS